MTRIPALAIACVLLSAVSWGFGISAVKHALDYLPPPQLLVLQLVFSALVLAAIAAAGRPSFPRFLGERLTAIQIVGGIILVGALLPIARQHDAHGIEDTAK